ncbi:MAG: DUF4363 family protein [Firmicutes bacterium]|nr:DUF4363 family protein [Bacillota bacterium]
MKVWLMAVGGLVIFSVAAWMIQYQTQKATERLGRYIARADAALEKWDWGAGRKELESLKSTWKRTKPGWSLFLHHKEIDAIDQALTRTLRAVKSRDYAAAQIELGDLQQLLEHIPEIQKLGWVNVL